VKRDYKKNVVGRINIKKYNSRRVVIANPKEKTVEERLLLGVGSEEKGCNSQTAEALIDGIL